MMHPWTFRRSISPSSGRRSESSESSARTVDSMAFDQRVVRLGEELRVDCCALPRAAIKKMLRAAKQDIGGRPHEGPKKNEN